MMLTPLLNKPQDTRRQAAIYNLSALNRDNCLTITIFRMKMRRVMIVI